MHVPMTNVTRGEKGLWPLGHSSSLLLCLGALPQHRSSHSQSAQRKALQSTESSENIKRCGPSAPCFGRRRPPAPQKHQVSSTCAARGIAAVRSPRRRGQLRIRKRITTASSSRNFVDSRARPAPVATPDRRRGLSQTNARRSPRRTGCCPRARSSPSRRRCCRSRAPVPQSTASRRGRPRVESCDARAGPQGRRGGGRGDLPAGRERPVARLAQEPARLGS